MQPFANLIERLRARGEQPFESYAEVSLQDVTLPFFALRRIAVVGGGYDIPALMLGDIHGRIGDLNQFLRR